MKLLLAIAGLLIPLLIFEGALHIHFYLQDAQTQARKKNTQFDEKLGWDVRPNIEYKISDAGFYEVDGNGFRFASKTNDPEKKTVLLIGDSFTHAPEISNEHLYYAPLSKLPINFYAYGVTAYNNIQEVLKVKELVEEIKPDILIWQLCSNDLIENVFEIEQRLGKVSFNRPYLDEKGSLFHDYEKSTWSSLQRLSTKGRSFQYIIAGIGNMIVNSKRNDQGHIVFDLTSKEMNTSREITRLSLERMRKTLPKKTKVVSFNSAPLPFEKGMIAKIAGEQGHIHINEIELFINQAKKKNSPYFQTDDFHWNVEGHQRVGEILRQKIENLLELQSL